MRELENSSGESWQVIGNIADPINAGFAKEVLKSYEVPAVVISKSGFFGTVGLNLPTFYKAGIDLFEVRVPSDRIEEANDLLTMALGDAWTPVDEKEDD